jgi:hypothetical protein
MFSYTHKQNVSSVSPVSVYVCAYSFFQFSTTCSSLCLIYVSNRFFQVQSVFFKTSKLVFLIFKSNRSFSRLFCFALSLLCIHRVLAVVAVVGGTLGTPLMPGAVLGVVPTTMQIMPATEGGIPRCLCPRAMAFLPLSWENGRWVV